MVGIILASHGDFAKGILHSAQMIFGIESNIAACAIMPSEGPEELRARMEEAINSFENPEQVLFLVDIWSGTPFNQANALMQGKEDKWAIIAGMNLPMLVEALSIRSDYETAHEIAKEILKVGREEVKVKPESLEVKTKSKPKNQDIPVLGNGKIEYVLARIDTRLLHGQVATSWTKTTNPNRIIVVSDNVSKDTLRKSMIVEAAPPGVKSHVVPISKMIEVDKDPRFGNTKAMLLFETPQDALKAIEGGVTIKELNLGSMAHSLGKVAVTTSVSLNNDDIETFEKLIELGINIDIRKVPSDSQIKIENILEKAKKELNK